MTAVETLKIISEREHFFTSCMVISQRSGMKFIEIETFYFVISLHFFSDKVTVLLQANTSPAIVFSKTGKNENDAKEAAAYVLLTYLKLTLCN